VNIVDSSGWIEYLTDGNGAKFFADPISNLPELLVPSICFYEVYRIVLREMGDKPAEAAAALMQTARVINLDMNIALSAAAIGHELKLAMADSVILATTRNFSATLWTQDADFKDIEGVKYRAKS